MKFEFDPDYHKGFSFLVVPNEHPEDAIMVLCTIDREESVISFLIEMDAVLEEIQNRMDDTEDYFDDVVKNAVMEVTEKYHGTCNFICPERTYSIWY